MTAPARMVELEAALAALPEGVVGEIVFGELVALPRPAPRHARAAFKIAGLLDGPFDARAGGPGGWVFLLEPELRLGPHVVVPDIAGWRRETMEEVPDVARIAVAPDWVCEVLSPRTEAFDRDEKMTIYGANDVRFQWLVDVQHARVEAFRSHRGKWEALGSFSGDDASVPPFDAVPLALSRVFAR